MNQVLNADASITNRIVRETGAVIIGGHFQGLGIIRSLGSQGIPLCLLDWDFCIGRFSRYPKKFFRCPAIRQEHLFFEFLKDIAKRESLEGWVIYPVDDETVDFLSRHKHQLEKYYRIPTPIWEITRFASHKKLTYQLAEKFDIAIPHTFYPENIRELENLKIEFPVILKPSIKEPFYSLTKKKAIRVDNCSELISRFKWAKAIYPPVELMVQEMIPGGPDNLFSVGSFFKNGQFLGKVVARRIRQHPMDFGHATTYAVTVKIPELEKITRMLLQAIGYYGLSEAEFMLDKRDGQFKLIEINPRTWGWHTLAIRAGVDLPYLLFQDMVGNSIHVDEFVENIKWFHLITDIPTALGEIRRGKLKFSEYFQSLGGRKSDAVWCLNDPLPFVIEILSAPYLWIKRGF